MSGLDIVQTVTSAILYYVLFCYFLAILAKEIKSETVPFYLTKYVRCQMSISELPVQLSQMFGVL